MADTTAQQRVIEVLLQQLTALKVRNTELREPPQFKLRALGFCGVDDSVSVQRLAEESRAHPWVEWAVLFREEMQGEPRFASWEWVEKLGQLYEASGRKMLIAGHLCSSHIDELFDGDNSFVKKLHSKYGFGYMFFVLFFFWFARSILVCISGEFRSTRLPPTE